MSEIIQEEILISQEGIRFESNNTKIKQEFSNRTYYRRKGVCVCMEGTKKEQ